MPTYEHKCGSCGDISTDFRSISAPEPTVCLKCGGPLSQYFRGSSAATYGDLEPYWSPLSGEWVTSRSQRREEIRKYNVVEVGNESLGGRSCPRKT